MELLGAAMTRKVIRADLHLLKSDEGGRVTPMTSGYRSIVRFQDNEADFGCELELELNSLSPGENGTGRLSFWAPEELPGLSVGQTFELREGTRIVGTGTILEA